MPTLQWIGKEAVVSHADNVPFRVLDKKSTFGTPDSGNRIIHGDNLEALKALLPEYEGKIKCIYIDPPYNTGNENWVYNDNVNSPRIRRWLGQVVGKEADDLSRHDKWLCMMYPRLVLLQKLLSNDGAIFISIDDNEQANLKLICDEIFGAGNFVDIFSWNKTETPANLSHKTKKAVEYVICYIKQQNSTKFRGLAKTSASNNGLMNQTNSVHRLIFPANKIDTKLPNGRYLAGHYGTSSYEIDLLEDTEVKNGIFVLPVHLQGRFKWGQDNLDRELEKGTIVSIKTKAFSPSYEKLEYEPEVPWNLINKKFGVGTNEMASELLTKIFGNKVFDFPKPPSLVEYMINFLCSPDSIILDSFAGSGTTAHAVLNLNKQDGGNRKFILVEMEDYADSITAERVRRVINGYGDTDGTGGGFDFYELGEPLFNNDKNLNENVGEQKIREYIWFSETHTPLQPPEYNDNGHFLGTINNCGYWFYYKKETTTTLDDSFLKSMKIKCEQYVIYADNCLLSQEFMRENNIVFKKIPRDIKKM